MKYLQVLKRLIKQVKYLVERQKTRRQLLYLTDEALRDVGITRRVAREQGFKPFWRR